MYQRVKNQCKLHHFVWSFTKISITIYQFLFFKIIFNFVYFIKIVFLFNFSFVICYSNELIRDYYYFIWVCAIVIFIILSFSELFWKYSVPQFYRCLRLCLLRSIRMCVCAQNFFFISFCIIKFKDATQKRYIGIIHWNWTHFDMIYSWECNGYSWKTEKVGEGMVDKEWEAKMLAITIKPKSPRK